MDDRRGKLIRRAAELKAESAALVMVNQELLEDSSGAGGRAGFHAELCSARIRSTEDADRPQSGVARVSSASSSGPVQRDSGTPVAAGSWQASATTVARGQLADPP
jgi:hypothetical protein